MAASNEISSSRFRKLSDVTRHVVLTDMHIFRYIILCIPDEVIFYLYYEGP